MPFGQRLVRILVEAPVVRARLHGDPARFGTEHHVAAFGRDGQVRVQKKDDETVVFGWILWPSREARDQGMPKAMADGRLMQETNPMPFDGKRMIYGGFETIVEV